MEHLTNIDRYFLEILREKNFIHSIICRDEKLSKAYLQCLDLMLLEHPHSWIKNHLKEVAKDAEEMLREYILNWKKESFYAPYREINKEFYNMSDGLLAEIANERGFI